MTEENDWLAVLGVAGAALLAVLAAAFSPKPAGVSSAQGTAAPAKAKTGCGCGH